jgi:hypothetical protein
MQYLSNKALSNLPGGLPAASETPIHASRKVSERYLKRAAAGWPMYGTALGHCIDKGRAAPSNVQISASHHFLTAD